jgi:arylsulfatase A-like enzyme
VARGQSAPPNVLIFMTDDQRSDTMFMMPKTQRLFGDQGTRFPSAYATTPLCCPSRASIMTGRYTHNHQVLDNFSALSLDQRSTLQRYMQEAGYLTGISGKYMNAWPLSSNPQYFHRWSIFNTGYNNARFNTDGFVRRQKGYATDVIGEQSVRFLRFFEGDDARPWLLYVDPFAPHDPFRPAHRHRKSPVPRWEQSPATTESDRSDKPPQVQARFAGTEGIKLVRRLQLRTLIAVDEAVSRVMRELTRLGEGGSTLAFFTSDNGFFWAEHGLYDKRWPYTPSIEIPLFVRWPGRVQGRAVDTRLAANIDITPTVLEATGITPDPSYPLDGRSLLGSELRSRLLIESFVDRLDPGVPAWASVLTHQYQYVEYYDANGQSVTFQEYYDLATDPHQLHNLMADDQQTGFQANLSSQLARDRRCRGTEGSAACP